MQGLEYFGSRGKICYVHFRDVKGSVPRFLEAFLGEGNCDPVEILRVLKRVGYRGFLIEDHVPILQGDNAWEARSRAYARLPRGVPARGGAPVGRAAGLSAGGRGGGYPSGVPRIRAMSGAKRVWLSSSGAYPRTRRALAKLQKRWVLPLMP